VSAQKKKKNPRTWSRTVVLLSSLAAEDPLGLVIMFRPCLSSQVVSRSTQSAPVKGVWPRVSYSDVESIKGNNFRRKLATRLGRVNEPFKQPTEKDPVSLLFLGALSAGVCPPCQWERRRDWTSHR
jgi:hypothetical protein